MKDEALDKALKALEIVKIHFLQNRHVNEAITAIKQALIVATPLAAPVQDGGVGDCAMCGAAYEDQVIKAPVQEPVAVVKVLPLGDGHKPMHWADWTDADNPPPEGTLLHTAAQRQWVGLTNQERSECWETIPELAMKKVEAKLRSKNELL